MSKKITLLFLIAVTSLALYMSIAKNETPPSRENRNAEPALQETNNAEPEKTAAEKKTDSEIMDLAVRINYSPNIENWKTYIDEEGYKFKYPEEMKSFEDAVDIYMTENLDEIRETYAQPEEEDEEIFACTGPCEKLSDSKFLESQFEMLKKAGQCTLDETLEKNIRENYLLYSDGNDKREEIKLIKHPGLDVCGIRIAGKDEDSQESETEKDIQNYYYRASFLKGDQTIFVSFLLVPLEVFSETDAFLEGLGYNLKEYECGEVCIENAGSVYEKILETPMAKSTVELYDEILKNMEITL